MDPTSCTSSGRPRVNPRYHRSSHESTGIGRGPAASRRRRGASGDRGGGADSTGGRPGGVRPRSNTISAGVSRGEQVCMSEERRFLCYIYTVHVIIFPRLSRSNVMNTVLTVLAYTVLSALAKPESMKQYECLLCPMLYFSVV